MHHTALSIHTHTSAYNMYIYIHSDSPMRRLLNDGKPVGEFSEEIRYSSDGNLKIRPRIVQFEKKMSKLHKLQIFSRLIFDRYDHRLHSILVYYSIFRINSGLPNRGRPLWNSLTDRIRCMAYVYAYAGILSYIYLHMSIIIIPAQHCNGRRQRTAKEPEHWG